MAQDQTAIDETHRLVRPDDINDQLDSEITPETQGLADGACEIRTLPIKNETSTVTRKRATRRTNGLRERFRLKISRDAKWT